MTESEKKRYEQYKLAYAAFIAVYPFGLEDLENEIWADIEGYEGDYQESNYGRTKSLKNGKIKILCPKLSRPGYLQVSLSKKGKPKIFSVHRLVAKCFIPNPQNLPEVNHKFGVKLDNYFKNLEWCTDAQNKRHALQFGLMQSGHDYPTSKLTEKDVRYIRENYKPHDKEFGEVALAKKFKVHSNTIDDILRFKRYKNVK